MVSFSRSLTSVAFLAALAACAAPGPQTAQHDGYINGCVRGHHDANPAGYEYIGGTGPNSERYKTDADYRTAWDDAHASCYEEERRTPRVVPGF